MSDANNSVADTSVTVIKDELELSSPTKVSSLFNI